MTRHTEAPTEVFRNKLNGQAILDISPELAEKIHPSDTIVLKNIGTYTCTKRVFHVTYVGEIINEIDIWVDIIDTTS